MKKVIIFVTLLLIGVFSVYAGMNQIDDEGLSLVYETEVQLHQGWNLVGGLVEPEEQIMRDSQIESDDLRAVYYYGNNRFMMTHPRMSPEFEVLKETGKLVCGDNSCHKEERENFNTWCPVDCSSDLSDDIINNVEVIGKETLILSKNERQTVHLGKTEFEVFWDDDAGYDNCNREAYDNVDCVMLHEDTAGPVNAHRFTNSPNDGNPNNDYFGRSHAISNNGKILVRVDYHDQDDGYEFTFYELKKSPRDYEGQQLPSFDEKAYSAGTWVYANEAGRVKYMSIVIQTPHRTLTPGWNFLTITPDLIGVKIRDWKGSCEFQKAYTYDAVDREWVTDDTINTAHFEPELEGMGLLVKVDNGCQLGQGAIGDGDVAPPPLPN